MPGDFEGIIFFDFDGPCASMGAKEAWLILREYCRGLTMGEFLDSLEGNLFQSRFYKDVNWEKFFLEYDRKLFNLNMVEGMPELLGELSNSMHLVVVTNRTTLPVMQYLRMHCGTFRFSKIFGREAGKTKSEIIKRVLEADNIPASSCYFVTDTLGDIRQGKKVGLKTIGVTWGFHSKSRLAKGRPDAIVTTVTELREAIAALVP